MTAPVEIVGDGRVEALRVVGNSFDASGALIAVFDVDATTRAAFDAVDAEALERLLRKVFAA